MTTSKKPTNRASPYPVIIQGILVGPGHAPLIIAGPDVIEDEASVLRHAERLKRICDHVGFPFILKCSYDKANRTSGASYRGPGLKKGLAILAKVKRALRVPVLSDVHCRQDVAAAADVLDVLQIPAFLCRQTDFVIAVAKAKRVVNIKKGQFLAPWDMRHVVAKAESVGNRQLLLTERGTSFGYNNLVSDLRSLQVMAGFGYPVIYDATHSVQLPGGQGDASGGNREFAPALARAAMATGFCHGLFFEVHEDPEHAPCDGPNMLRLDQFERLLFELKSIHQVIGSRSPS